MPCEFPDEQLWSVFLRRLKTPLNEDKPIRVLRTSDLSIISASIFARDEATFSRRALTDRNPSNAPSQADVKAFQQMKEAPAVEKYPHAYRWYKHIASFESEFGKLPGDASKDVTAYGPGAEELTINPAKAPEKKEEDDDEVDLFGSDDEVDEEAEKIKAARVEEYKQKKAGKAKPAAKSIVTLEVKPWGMYRFSLSLSRTHANQFCRRRD